MHRTDCSHPSLNIAKIATKKRLFKQSVLMGVLVAALTGCGGGGGNDAVSSTPSPVSAVDQFAAIRTPVVNGPLANEAFSSQTKNYQFFASDVALASRGYVEEEFYLEGNANAYDTPVPVFGPSPLPATFTTNVVRADVPYRTRMIVRRPTDPAKFNGTVVVEWLNVTDGFDGEYFWVQAKDHLLREGYAYVGLSAQDNAISVSPLSLKKFSTTRYGSLDVTGAGTVTADALSYDIFSQAAKAVRSVPSVIKGLSVQNVLGIGMSQSGMRLGVYANYLHKQAPIYQGFLIQVANQPIRDDLGTPVIKVLSESEATSNSLTGSQADTPTRRTWWVAGSSHGDSVQRMGRTPVRLRDLGLSNTGNDACAGGATPTRPRTPFKHVVSAAVYHLKRQVETGALPPSGAELSMPLVISSNLPK